MHGVVSFHKILNHILMLVTIDFSRDDLNLKSPVAKDGVSADKGNSTTDSGVITQDVKMNTLEGKNYQPESKVDSSAL